MTKSIRIRKDQWQAVQAHYKARGFRSFAGWVGYLMEQDMASERNQDGHTGTQDQPMDGQMDLFSRSD